MSSRKPQCHFCEKTFSLKHNLLKHIRVVHKVQNSELDAPYICVEKDCKIRCTTAKKLRAHLSAAHSIDFKSVCLGFENIDQFNAWKDSREEDEDCNFVKSTGKKVLKGGGKKLYFNCHRSGTVRLKQNTMRLSQGSCKLGFNCTAAMTVTEMTDGKIDCIYYPKHYGHKKEIGKVNLTEREKNQIAVKLSQKISKSVILKDIRDNLASREKVSRIHLTTKQDLCNIERKYGICGPQRHPDDATSVSIMISDFEKEGNNPIIAHKFQGATGTGNLAGLEIDDVFFVIMHPIQNIMLKKYGMNIICIDSTHGTNRYGFNLISLLVIDEYEEGCPVAFCLCSREDSSTIKIFFSVLRESIEFDLKPKVFMSDDAPAFYNAWEQIFGPVKHKLLCAWHVERAIRFKLQSTFKDKELLCKVYNSLTLLLDETDEEEFKMLYLNIKDLFENENVKQFGQYFFKTYGSRMQEIASCYRQNLGINTNMYLESFHRVFKYNFLKAKTNNRVDVCLYQITEFIKDQALNQIKKIERCKYTNKIRMSSNRHKSSLNLDFSSVNKEGNKYIVKSAKLANKKYEVIMTSDVCKCKVKCRECAFCIHEVSCTCEDYLIRNVLCKHCHLVLRKIKILGNECNEEKETNDTNEKRETNDTNEKREVDDTNEEKKANCTNIEKVASDTNEKKDKNDNPEKEELDSNEINIFKPKILESVKSVSKESSDVSNIHQFLKGKKSNLNQCEFLLKNISEQLVNLNPETDSEIIKNACNMLTDVNDFLIASNSTSKKVLPDIKCKSVKIKTQRSFYSTRKKAGPKKNAFRKVSLKEKESIRKEILNVNSNSEENVEIASDHSYSKQNEATYQQNEASLKLTNKKKVKVLTKDQHILLEKLVNCKIHFIFAKEEHVNIKQLKHIDEIPDDIIDFDVNPIKDLLSQESLESLEDIIKKKREIWNCSMCSNVTTKETMIECETCLKWIHFSCAGLKENKEYGEWNCDFCRNKIKDSGELKF